MKKIALVFLALCLCVAMFGCTAATTAKPAETTAAPTGEATTTEPTPGLHFEPAPEKGPTWYFAYDYAAAIGSAFPATTNDPAAVFSLQALDGPGGAVLADIQSADGYIDISTLPEGTKVFKITMPVNFGDASKEFELPAAH